MSDIWIISDTHLNHRNILNFKDYDGNPVRPEFENVEHMNEFMLDKWNEVVKPGDKVYHLGDVFFGSKAEFEKLWPKFNGRKRLIVGNHDDIKYLSSGAFFDKVLESRKWGDWKLLLSHRPCHPGELAEGWMNIHGHVHRNSLNDARYLNVSAEVVGYTPVHIEEILICKREVLNV